MPFPAFHCPSWDCCVSNRLSVFICLIPRYANFTRPFSCSFCSPLTLAIPVPASWLSNSLAPAIPIYPSLPPAFENFRLRTSPNSLLFGIFIFPFLDAFFFYPYYLRWIKVFFFCFPFPLYIFPLHYLLHHLQFLILFPSFPHFCFGVGITGIRGYRSSLSLFTLPFIRL